jgi:hypothetical protein
MKTRCSLSYSRDHSVDPYLNSDESSLRPTYVFITRAFSFTLKSPKLIPTFKFYTKTFGAFSACSMSHQLNFLYYINIITVYLWRIRDVKLHKMLRSSWNKPWSPRGSVEVYSYSFFNLGVSWGLKVNATPRKLYPRERASTHDTGGIW